MKSSILLAVIAMMLTACVTPRVTLDAKSGGALKGKTVVTTTRFMKPRFQIVSAFNAPSFSVGRMTASASAMESIKANERERENEKELFQVIEVNRVADPAEDIGRELATFMEGTHGTTTIMPVVPIAREESLVDVDRLKTPLKKGSTTQAISLAAQGRAHHVLDVETKMWGFNAFPTQWFRYQVQYIALARLIDTSSNAVIGQAACKIRLGTKETAPSYEELTGNGAQLLKSQLAIAAKQCLATLKKDLLHT